MNTWLALMLATAFLVLLTLNAFWFRRNRHRKPEEDEIMPPL